MIAPTFGPETTGTTVVIVADAVVVSASGVPVVSGVVVFTSSFPDFVMYRPTLRTPNSKLPVPSAMTTVSKVQPSK